MAKNVYYMATIVELYYGDIKFQFVNPGSVESLLDFGYNKVIIICYIKFTKVNLSISIVNLKAITFVESCFIRSCGEKKICEVAWLKSY